MTEPQRTRLGQMVAKARERKGFSTRQLAAATGLSTMWISDLERGRYEQPAPDRLARLGEVLDIDPSRIERITRTSVADALPGMRTYFRATTNLTTDQIDQLEDYVQQLQKGQS